MAQSKTERLNFFRLFLNRCYHYWFVEKFNKKLKIKFPENIYRWDLTQFLIDKYNFKNYLEIGCDDDKSFSKIEVQKKIGVDPFSGGTIRDTSDNFFKNNNEYFDLIFIDGLHEYKQVKRDINNSLKFLNQSGFILIHDCLPRTKAHQAIPRYRGSWNGDVWKALVEVRTRIDLETFTCKIDYGVGIIQKKNNSDILNIEIDDFQNLRFEDYYSNNNKYMRIISYEELKEKFN